MLPAQKSPATCCRYDFKQREANTFLLSHEDQVQFVENGHCSDEAQHDKVASQILELNPIINHDSPQSSKYSSSADSDIQKLDIIMQSFSSFNNIVDEQQNLEILHGEQKEGLTDLQQLKKHQSRTSKPYQIKISEYDQGTELEESNAPDKTQANQQRHIRKSQSLNIRHKN